MLLQREGKEQQERLCCIPHQLAKITIVSSAAFIPGSITCSLASVGSRAEKGALGEELEMLRNVISSWNGLGWKGH